MKSAETFLETLLGDGPAFAKTNPVTTLPAEVEFTAYCGLKLVPLRGLSWFASTARAPWISHR